jgi:DNA-directed RNA polymerase subunit L
MAYRFVSESEGVLKFRLSEVDKSYANALRRTLIGNIPIVVMKPEDCTITKNTSRFTNEIIKHRLSCIPVHKKNPHMAESIKQEISKLPWTVEISMINTTQEMMYITTQSFKVKHGDEYLSDAEVHKMFPPNDITKDYIEFLRLRPKFGESVEELTLSCELSIGTGNESGVYNSAGTCSYACTHDKDASDEAWTKVQDSKTIMDKHNWELLDAKRFIVNNSFDFVLETIGVYSNKELLFAAITILQIQLLHTPAISVESSVTTMQNAVDVHIPNGDYTLGKIIEFQLVTTLFPQKVTYVSFLKSHPHDPHGILRIAFVDQQDQEGVIVMYKEASDQANQVLERIKSSLK